MKIKFDKLRTKKNKKIIIITFILICIFLLCIRFQNKLDFKDDLIFFKTFGKNQENNLNSKFNNLIQEKQSQITQIDKSKINSNQTQEILIKKEETQLDSSIKQYFFNVDYKNIEFKAINLLDTIDNKTLVNKKIAPGTRGKFDIVIKSNIEINYQVKIESKNEKPQNLRFTKYGNNQEYNSLEDLQKILNGSVGPNETEIITINWNWKYANNEEENIQDTKDGINIQKYNFNIYVIGEQK